MEIYCTDEDEKERDVIIPLHDVRPNGPGAVPETEPFTTSSEAGYSEL